MPYVTVVFDPGRVSQGTVTKIKRWLQPEVARVLSIVDTIADDFSNFDPRETPKNIWTTPEEIMVI